MKHDGRTEELTSVNLPGGGPEGLVFVSLGVRSLRFKGFSRAPLDFMSLDVS